MAKKNAEIERPTKIGEKGGSPGRAAHHEGEAGAGEKRDLGGGKFAKDTRDSVSEKEAGKSRGAGE